MVRPRERKISATPRRRKNGTERPKRPGMERILVTGVSGYWGSRMLLALEEDERIERIVAVDRDPPRIPHRRAEVVQLSLENPLVADLLINRGIQTIVHLQVSGDEHGRERMFRNNVLGTRHLLSAAKQVGIKRLITRSSTFVYGASLDNPFYLPESWRPRGRTRNPYVRDMVDNEIDYQDHWASGAGPELCVMRFAPILGPTVLSQMSRYLKNPVLYSILGMDPLWQFTHEDDVLRALLHALEVPFVGPVNIAGDGVLPVSRVVAMTGKPSVPAMPQLLPLVLKPLSLLPGTYYPSLPTDHLRYVCLADTRRMKEEFGFQPEFTTVQALESFLEGEGQERPRGPEFTLEYSEFARRALEEVLESDEEGAQ